MESSIGAATSGFQNVAGVSAAMMTVLMIYLVVVGVFGIVFLASYIMNAVALSRLASRRGIKRPWLAWIPVGTDWIIGSIVDEYDERNGIKRKWRVVLLVLLILVLVCAGAYFVGYFYIVFTTFSKIGVNAALGMSILKDMIVGLIICYAALIVLVMVGTALNAVRTICFYKIFESTVPKRAVAYLLLMLIVPLAGSICLMLCKEKGYPEKDADESLDEQMEAVFAETYEEE